MDPRAGQGRWRGLLLSLGLSLLLGIFVLRQESASAPSPTSNRPEAPRRGRLPVAREPLAPTPTPAAGAGVRSAARGASGTGEEALQAVARRPEQVSMDAGSDAVDLAASPARRSAPRDAGPAPVELPPLAPARVHHAVFTHLQRWSQPGMCSGGTEVDETRQALLAHFQDWDGGDQGHFHIDPRLTGEAISPILGDLVEAEIEVGRRLEIHVQRPETFVYFDRQLLTASGCVGPNVWAYYDGALHVVAGDPDLEASVLHEYTHHALMSSGLLGPAWAQEGIAMNIARETWWQNSRVLQPLLEEPFGIDTLDDVIPYKLPADRAVQFYAQSAALVACVLSSRQWELYALLEALQRGADGSNDSLDYDLPEVEQPSFWRACAKRWLG